MDNYNENNFNCNDINFAAPGTASQGEMTVGARNPDTMLCEPKKPVSAYALFFKDTVSAIKGQRPDVTYAEICTIVASMWEALDEPHKNVYHKKNELAKKEYVLQMSAYRLQQQQFHQQSEISNENQLSTTAASTTTTTTTTSPRQQLTKPAVFTIARPTHDNSTHITTSQPITTSQKNLISTSSPSFQYPQSMSTASMASGAAATTATTAAVNSLCSTDTATNTIPHNYNMDPPQLNQMLNDSICSVQKCIRDSCPKRAIINPDWEDEYCSNECVVLHCRNVFNAWVQSNLETRAG